MRIADLDCLNLQYITDGGGKKTGIILPITEFEELLEDIQDLAVAAERYREPTISHDELLTELKNDGFI